ncbi:hypothetical protein D9613_011881 [Agrocybe pediades]|uniref:Polyketide synthase-like phosphopantetheine-binding domain-containing protein n=1 Tax=Agrocybe pediades TaxID=84607 RepID=A0A8H4QKP9_9AGAR|nr:hypothetical protein D9613_011881 [Agrocybe pediades]
MADGISLIAASLATVGIESFLYGVFFLLSILSVYLLVWRQKSASPRKKVVSEPLFIATCAMFTTVTAHWIITFIRLFDAFINFNGGQTPILYYGDLRRTTEVMKTAFLVATLVISDAVVIYRLWVVWNYNKTIVIFPLSTLVGLMVCGSGITYQFSIFPLGNDVFTSVAGRWITSSTVLSMCTNIYSTGLISWRIWQINAASRHTRGRSSLNSVLAIIVESAAIYTTWAVFFFATYLAETNLQFFTIDAFPEMAGIAFMLIITRVGLGWAQKAVAPLSGSVSRVQDSQSSGTQQDSIALRPLAINIAKTVDRTDEYHVGPKAFDPEYMVANAILDAAAFVIIPRQDAVCLHSRCAARYMATENLIRETQDCVKPQYSASRMIRIIPKPPQTQALSSQTFQPPPLDGTLSIPELYDWHLKNSPKHPLFVYACGNNNNDVRTILWGEAVKAIHSGTRIVRKTMGWKPGQTNPPVVAILAASGEQSNKSKVTKFGLPFDSADSITYFTMSMSILRAGYAAFPISPRNSPAAVAHLLNKVNVKCLFVGKDTGILELASSALDLLDASQHASSKPLTAQMPTFEELFLDYPGEADDIPFERRGDDEIVFYIHSSGSTSFPKPIPWTGYRMSQVALPTYFGERDLTGVIWSLHIMPMYHGLGVMQLCLAPSTGHVLSVFEPKSPAIAPTPKNHFEAAAACKSNVIFSVPAIIAEWSRHPDYVEWLSTRDAVIFGGGPLNKAVGNFLTSKGVPIFNLYGCSEGGILSTVLPANADNDWEYFRFSGHIKAEMRPQGDGTYEFVMVNNPLCEVCVVNTQVNGVDAYATSDLFTEHPQKPGYWRIYGRKDDQIMHSTGEKTNPGPLEDILNRDPLVQSSLIFGRGRFQAGVLINPKPEFQFDSTDEAKLADFRNKVWPTVKSMNAFAPQHSRIFKEAIIVTKPSKPFVYTAKGTPRRQTVLEVYEDEIKAMYDAITDSSQSEIQPPDEWDLVHTLDFVREILRKVFSHNLDDDMDIFEHGCDSLQATWIRNALLRALRESAYIDTRGIEDNFVYDHPTILSLASFMRQLATAENDQVSDTALSRPHAMRAMVEKYQYNPSPAAKLIPREAHMSSEGDVVIVTGTTGGLGSYLLAELVGSADVARVYALNRASRGGRCTLADRQRKSLIDRGLSAEAVLGSEKLQLLEVDLTLPNFGLIKDVYDKLSSSVTHIIHNAWPVDFNLSLTSFETSIKGLHNLVQFALDTASPSPRTIIFTSSIGVLRNTESQNESTIHEGPVPPEIAVGTGYSESKWVAEEMLMHASRNSTLNAIIVRVGQISGGLNGYWNTAEWLPSLVQSAQIFGCLPNDDRTVDWIPLHIAAKALVDYRKCGSPSLSTILHLTHPKPAPWSLLAKAIAQNLSIDLVSYAEWLEKLRRAATSGKDERADIEAMRRIPALRLLPFFQAMSSRQAGCSNAFGFPRLDNHGAVRLSDTLSKSTDHMELGNKDVESWMKYWESVGFVQK